MRCDAVYHCDVCGGGVVAGLCVCVLRLQLGKGVDSGRGAAAQAAADVEVGKGHEEEGREGCAEEGTIDGLEARVGWGIYVEAGGTEQLDRLVAGAVVQADRKDFARVAVYARAGAEVLELVLLRHLLDAWPRCDVALVYQAIEQLGRALYYAQIRGYPQMSPLARSPVGSPLVTQDLVLLFLFLLVVVLWLDVQDHLQCLLVHGHLRLQARQVEVVLDEVLRDLSEVLVAEQATEGRDPRLGDLRRR